MDDYRVLREIAARHKRKLLGIAVVLLLAVLYPGPEVDMIEVSPDKTYRLEYHHPGLFPALYYRYIKGMHDPAFLRLYRNGDNEFFGESPVLDFFGGGSPTYWLIDTENKVKIGGEFVFKDVPPTK